MSEGGIALFTYGTLQPGEAGAARLPAVTAHAPGVLRGHRLYDTGLGWPIATMGEASDVVHGMIVWLVLAESDLSPSEVLASVDAYEECDPADPKGSLYIRAEREVTTTSEPVPAFVYLSSPARLARRYPAARLEPIVSGRWPRAVDS